MNKNSEFAKCASDLAHSQDVIRCANEDLIKLSQRFGRMVPKLQRLESSSLISWFHLYNQIKDAANESEEELSAILGSEQIGGANPVLQSQISYFLSQKARLYSKIEVIDDILSGIIEDLLENGSFEESQKQEMLLALDSTMAKSRHRFEISVSSSLRLTSAS